MASNGDWKGAIARPVTATDTRQNVVDWGWGVEVGCISASRARRGGQHAKLGARGPRAMTGYQRISSVAIGAAVLCALFGSPAVPGSWQQLPGPAAAMGQVMVFNQPRHPVGGPGADTSFIDDGGNSIWQQVADDIILSQDATIGRIKWFGFYGGTFTGSTQPPAAQTMRIRFYDSRPVDGLPGAILFEESIVDPPRFPTGAVLPLPLAPIEQRFEVDLSTPFDMLTGVQYWMEIVQLGDLNSHYRWEFSPGNGSPYAFINPNVIDWRRSTASSNLTFELWTVPEPSTFLLVLGALALPLTRPRTRH